MLYFSVADIPGLIENAHKNEGLGFAFLKHIERFVVFSDSLPVLRVNLSNNILTIFIFVWVLYTIFWNKPIFRNGTTRILFSERIFCLSKFFIIRLFSWSFVCLNEFFVCFFRIVSSQRKIACSSIITLLQTKNQRKTSQIYDLTK